MLTCGKGPYILREKLLFTCFCTYNLSRTQLCFSLSWMLCIWRGRSCSTLNQGVLILQEVLCSVYEESKRQPRPWRARWNEEGIWVHAFSYWCVLDRYIGKCMCAYVSWHLCDWSQCSDCTDHQNSAAYKLVSCSTVFPCLFNRFWHHCRACLAGVHFISESSSSTSPTGPSLKQFWLHQIARAVLCLLVFRF